MGAWFERHIGGCFNIDGSEYIFQGTFTNTDTTSGKPYQYVFEAENKPQIILMYNEARSVLGAMIDKYKGIS
ncbi:hypothetical protein H70357_24675 [Paenibacillus sp. FSL H7-0357]|nr:hypothetical protein H70357_24675 [Paenibacillus sp. FSL H7-0357]